MADAPPPKPTPGPSVAEKPQPKIVHRLALRTLMAVVFLGALFYGLMAWRDWSRDPNRVGSVNTVDAIAAVEFLNEGQQAVIIKPGGEILRSPDFKPGNVERDLAWQPDGNRLYYVSDRENLTFQVYRWRPIPGGESEARTLGTRGKSNPAFDAGKAQDENLLMTSGGVVLELNPVDRKMHQVLPPLSNEVVTENPDEGGGGTSQFSGAYGRLGESFASAQYLPGREMVVAVMRSDRGEVLILQDLRPSNGKLKPPAPISAGDRVQYSVSPEGKIVYAVQNFQWATEPPREFVQNGKVTTPFRHLIAYVDPLKEESAPIGFSKDNDIAFSSPAISPDGTRTLVVVGSYDGNNFTPRVLATFPVREGGSNAGAKLIDGEIYEPAWHPNGTKLVFVKRENGKRSIYTAKDDGSEETKIGGDASFGRPIFSPQAAK